MKYFIFITCIRLFVTVQNNKSLTVVKLTISFSTEVGFSFFKCMKLINLTFFKKHSLYNVQTEVLFYLYN